jgi:hypothetical protein
LFQSIDFYIKNYSRQTPEALLNDAVSASSPSAALISALLEISTLPAGQEIGRASPSSAEIKIRFL